MFPRQLLLDLKSTLCPPMPAESKRAKKRSYIASSLCFTGIKRGPINEDKETSEADNTQVRKAEVTIRLLLVRQTYDVRFVRKPVPALFLLASRIMRTLERHTSTSLKCPHILPIFHVVYSSG